MYQLFYLEVVVHARLWPLSRKQYPKQYLPLVSDNTMLQETILRLDGLDNLADPIIVCNVNHRFLVAEQCQQIGIKNPTILLEPVGRNTAPAIAAAAIQIIQDDNKDATLLVLPTDHVIQDITAFHQAINIASQQAQSGKLATFGIVPTDANTGYGYIKSSKGGIDGAYKVEEFVEKPNLKTARSYLEQGNYLWNSGMFMFKATTLIGELITHSPNIVKSVNNAINNATQDFDFIRLEKQAFESSPSDSIDYALMEKSDSVVVVPLDAQWNDIGAWSALYDIGVKDSQGNVIKGDVITQDTTNTYINADQHCTDFRSVMPTNLYGVNDNFHPENSHVIPALMQRFHQAKVNNNTEVVVWGTGKVMREFLYVDDMAQASLFVLELDEQTYKANTQPMLSHINIGTGKDITIREMAEIMKHVTGYKGELTFDTTKPDGALRKLIDVTRLKNMGWRYTIDLKYGLEKTYKWYLKQG